MIENSKYYGPRLRGYAERLTKSRAADVLYAQDQFLGDVWNILLGGPYTADEVRGRLVDKPSEDQLWEALSALEWRGFIRSAERDGQQALAWVAWWDKKVVRGADGQIRWSDEP